VGPLPVAATPLGAIAAAAANTVVAAADAANRRYRWCRRYRERARGGRHAGAACHASAAPRSRRGLPRQRDDVRRRRRLCGERHGRPRYRNLWYRARHGRRRRRRRPSAGAAAPVGPRWRARSGGGGRGGGAAGGAAKGGGAFVLPGVGVKPLEAGHNLSEGGPAGAGAGAGARGQWAGVAGRAGASTARLPTC
jgi:hypothetical protein